MVIAEETDYRAGDEVVRIEIYIFSFFLSFFGATKLTLEYSN
jgi:hypothetical protein